jgi:hypothetical protein
MTDKRESPDLASAAVTAGLLAFALKKQRNGETIMHKPLRLSLAAGLTIASVGAAAAADSDPCVWRWYVTNAMRAQQDNADRPPVLREVRASAIEQFSRFLQRNERYFTDGSLAPQGDAALR